MLFRSATPLGREDALRMLAQRRVEEVGFVCDLEPLDHVHVVRCGEKGSGLEGRALVLFHGLDEETGEVVDEAPLYFSAARARSLASALLNVADDLDGKTRLSFVPESTPTVEHPLGDEEAPGEP